MNTHFQFGQFELRTEERLLLQDGAPVALGPRTLDFLICLVSNHHRHLGKDELLHMVWPGLVVEENNLTVQVSALRKLLGSEAISTLTGRGYRFSLPVNKPASSEARKQATLAVLPFKQLGTNTELGFLGQGLVEDVISLLARVPGFLVISQASTQVFENTPANLADIASQLQVHYVVLGSMRKVGEQLRVNVQLADASTSLVLWSGRFECTPNAAEDLQEQIAIALLGELQPQLVRAEVQRIRRQRPNNLDAWACYHLAIDALALQGWSASGLLEARRQLEKSIAAESTFGLAHAHWALLTALSRNIGLIAFTERDKLNALQAAEKAIELDPGSSEVLGYAGCTLCDLGYTQQGLAVLQNALALNPSNAQAQVAEGAALVLMNHFESGIAKMRLGMRLSPKDRRLGFWLWITSCFLLRAGRALEALQEARKSALHDTRFHLAHVAQAAALDKLGQKEEAALALAQARALRPALTLEEIGQAHGAKTAARLGFFW